MNRLASSGSTGMRLITPDQIAFSRSWSGDEFTSRHNV